MASIVKMWFSILFFAFICKKLNLWRIVKSFAIIIYFKGTLLVSILKNSNYPKHLRTNERLPNTGEMTELKSENIYDDVKHVELKIF